MSQFKMLLLTSTTYWNVLLSNGLRAIVHSLKQCFVDLMMSSLHPQSQNKLLFGYTKDFIYIRIANPFSNDSTVLLQSGIEWAPGNNKLLIPVRQFKADVNRIRILKFLCLTI